MSDLASSASPQLQLVNDFVQGISEADVDIIAKHLHKDFRRVMYPRSLGSRELAREEWLKNMAGVITFTTDLKTTYHSVIEIPGKVVVHETTKAKTSFGVDVEQESIYITHIVTDEDGSLKIVLLEVFADSQVYVDLFRVAAEAKAKEQNYAA